MLRRNKELELEAMNELNLNENDFEEYDESKFEDNSNE